MTSTPCSHPASLQPAPSEPRGTMPVLAGSPGALPRLSSRQRSQSIADTFLRLAGWETAPLGRAPLFRGHGCWCTPGHRSCGERRLRPEERSVPWQRTGDTGSV